MVMLSEHERAVIHTVDWAIVKSKVNIDQFRVKQKKKIE
jgi:hypothetical protein